MSIIEALKVKGFLKTTGMTALAQSLKTHGFKATIKKFGWKLFAVIFVLYLIRDVVIYILIPLWLTQSFFK
jgi:hypothetical protein